MRLDSKLSPLTGYLIAGLILGGAVLFLVDIGFADINIFLTIAVVLLAIPVFANLLPGPKAREPADWLHPIYVFLAAYLFSFIIRPVGLALGGYTAFVVGQFRSYAVLGAFQATTGLVVLSLVCCYLGYCLVWWAHNAYLPRKQRKCPEYRLSETKYTINYSRLRLIIWVSILVTGSGLGLVLYLMVQQAGTLRMALASRLLALQGLGYPVLAVQMFPVIYICWFLCHLVSGKSLKSPMLWIGLAASSIVLLLLGGRAPLLVLFLSLLVVLHYLRPRRRNARLILVGLAFLMFVGVFGVWRSYITLTPWQAFQTYLTSIKKMGILGPIWHLGNVVTEFDALTVIVQSVPDRLPYQYGRTYLALITAPLPRKLAPNKLPSAAEILNSRLLPERWIMGTGIRPSLLGEFYMNFGCLGIVGGLVIVGWLLAILYYWFLGNRGNPLVLLFYSITAGHIPAAVRGDFTGTMISYLTFLLPSLLTLKLVMKSTKSPMR